VQSIKEIVADSAHQLAYFLIIIKAEGKPLIMLKKLKDLSVKYREIIVYLIVGFLTTVVSWAASFVFKLFADL